MKIILSAAISLDGYLDDNTQQRLKLSSPEDWDDVKLLRTRCDAILVGAETVRRDNPSLVIGEVAHRAERVERGLKPDIVKVTVTRSGELDPAFDFFQKGEGEKIVITEATANPKNLEMLEPYATIVKQREVTALSIVDTLKGMGIKSLMVEGGSHILTMFLEEGVVDELRLAIAPIFVGDSGAPRLVNEGEFLWNKDNRMHLDRVEKMGDTAVLFYKNK